MCVMCLEQRTKMSTTWFWNQKIATCDNWMSFVVLCCLQEYESCFTFYHSCLFFTSCSACWWSIDWSTWLKFQKIECYSLVFTLLLIFFCNDCCTVHLCISFSLLAVQACANKFWFQVVSACQLLWILRHVSLPRRIEWCYCGGLEHPR